MIDNNSELGPAVLIATKLVKFQGLAVCANNAPLIAVREQAKAKIPRDLSTLHSVGPSVTTKKKR